MCAHNVKVGVSKSSESFWISTKFVHILHISSKISSAELKDASGTSQIKPKVG